MICQFCKDGVRFNEEEYKLETCRYCRGTGDEKPIQEEV